MLHGITIYHGYHASGLDECYTFTKVWLDRQRYAFNVVRPAICYVFKDALKVPVSFCGFYNLL